MPKTHGLTQGGKPPEYYIWIQMKQRCYNPNHKRYKDYGARGIFVCDLWKKSFDSFISDVGWRDNNSLTLERIDNNDGYHPKNVKWATKTEQSSNKRNNINVNGKCLKSYCRDNDIKYGTVHSRIYKSKWDITKAIGEKNVGRFK